MPWISRVRSFLWHHLRRGHAEADLQAEVQAFYDEITERRVSQGETYPQARRGVRLEFGGMEQVKERTREARAGFALETTLQDTRYALRTLRTNPGLTAVAVLVLGLGIGAASSIFSVVNAVLLRPLPYQDPSRLVAISSAYRNGDIGRTVTLNDVEGWRHLSRCLESIGSFVFTAFPVGVGGASRFVVAIGADQELLRTMGVTPELGANFANGGSNHQESSAIVSHKLWMDQLHGDPSVIGRSIMLDGAPYILTGVLPASFQFPRADASYFADDPDVLFPIANVADNWGRDSAQWFAIARLRPGIPIAQAEAELKALTLNFSLQSIRSPKLAALDAETTAAVHVPLLLLMGVSIVLLLIACTNLMNLLLAGSSGRGREMAIREASGATRGRLIRQMLTESACLTLLGGAAGLALAWSVTGLLVAISPSHLPVNGRVDIDFTVFGFALALCAGVVLLAGLFPAARASLHREGLLAGSGSREFGGKKPVGIKRALTVAQVALGYALLAAAALLTGSLARLNAVDPGFRNTGIVGIPLVIPSDHSWPQTIQTIDSILEQIRAVPGVRSAGWVTYLPPETRQGSFMPFQVAGASPPPRTPVANFQVASDGYFGTVEILLSQGRDFSTADRVGSPPVMIVNRAFALAYLRGRDPLGQHLITSFDSRDSPREIVGVVGDTHDRGLGMPAIPTAFLPSLQVPRGFGWMAVRTDLASDRIVPEIRRRIAGIDSSVPITAVATVGDRIRKSLDTPRFYSALAGACGIMAVLFVTLGLYGVVSYSVSRRTTEIGVRMALGARGRDIRRTVLGEGVWMAVLGISLGLILYIAASRVLTSLLFHLKPNDPWLLGLAAVLILMVTLGASYVPARRASRTDPMSALRHQ